MLMRDMLAIAKPC